MDGGNREEEDRLGPGHASLPFSNQPPPATTYRLHHSPSHHHHQHHQHHHQHHQQHHHLAPSAFDPFPNQLSSASYAANNASAVATNAAPAATDDLASSLHPADFYRSYHAAPPPPPADTSVLVSPAQDLMAPAFSGHRQPPSLRSNSNGTTPKHPPVPAGRNGLRSAHRSASNPVDDRSASAAGKSNAALSNGYSGVAQTSVKDLKKRFDYTTAHPSEPSRKPSSSSSSRNPTLDSSHSPSINGKSPVDGSNQASYFALRSASVRERVSDSAKESSSRGSQRTKVSAEDQLSGNPQSFASRINKPRTSVSENEQASKSMTHLPPQPSPRATPMSPGGAPRPNGLLFGEILPDQNDATTAGYGIDGVRPRRTSESSLQSPTRPQFASQPNANPEPSSPADWYRGVASPRSNHDPQAGSRLPTNHSRAHSDLAGSKARQNVMPPPPLQPVSTSSRLPVSVRKVASPPTPSSPVSPRSRSPTSVGKRPSTAGRTSRQQQTYPPTTRAKTPTKRSTTPTSRAKTPTHATPSSSSSSSRKQPPSQITTPSNNRLNAYITAPPPKLSPPLRSSRPRQPVSTASTASSRMKTVDGSRSAHPSSSSRHSSRRGDDSSTSKRKIEIGPIDFAQRRETIRLAYSKSIKETEAKVARQAAAERRRRREAEAVVARARAEAEAEAAAALSALTVHAGHDADGRASEGESASEPTLTLMTGPKPTVPALPQTGDHQSPNFDSPTLGLPGTFPSFGSPPLEQDETPQSAVSANTVVTEFDHEAQTEPAPAADTVSHANLGMLTREPAGINHEKAEYRSPFELPLLEEPEIQHEDTAITEPPSSSHEKATYRYPFEDDGNDDDVPIKISIDTSRPHTAQPHREFDVPGSFKDELETQNEQVPIHEEPAVLSDARFQPEPEYEPQPYRSDSFQTTITIVSRDSDFAGSAPPPPRPALNEPQMDSLEEFYVGPSIRDNMAALRDSTFAPSEFSDENPQTSAEIQHTPDTSNSLTIPPLLSPANRSSQQSGWTDFSIDSSDGHEYLARDPAVHSREHIVRSRRSTQPIVSRPDSLTNDPRFEDGQYSPGLSPLDESHLHDAYGKKPLLPDLDTGDGFSVSYPSDGVAPPPPIPNLPDHEPPPIPTPDGRQTPSSGYYDQTRPNSYMQSTRDDQSSYTFISRRESEDYPPPMSTPPSADQVMVDMPGQAIGAEQDAACVEGIDPAGSENLGTEKQQPVNKERSRLTQRQMVIKELIDTEAIFVRDMNIVEEIYKGTAEACPKLDSKTVKLIFRNTDEIIGFHTAFLTQLKDGVSAVYSPAKGRKSPQLKDQKDDSNLSDAATLNSVTSSAPSSHTLVDSDDLKDRQTSVGPVFTANVDKMRTVHEGFLRTSDPAAKRLIQIQEDPTVKVWLSECNEVAKDLTAAWNLDSLLIKPMQRITKYPNLISQLLQYTPADHPDREPLLSARTTLENAILDINKTKKNFELVGQIVGRKRKESDVRAGFARAFGKRVDKLQASSNRPTEDPEYLKLNEKFGDDYLRLQVVLRDVEYYTRTVSGYVHEFLQYLSAMELVMRLQPSPYPELESKWARFNVSMRDMEKVALDQHLAQVRKHVIEPFELVIKCYGNPSLAMKKRAKRRLDYEKAVQLKKSGKKVDKQLSELVEQYEALNETLKKELPMLSANTEKIGNICLGNFVNIQAKWFSIWKEKVKVVLGDSHVPELSEVVTTFQREFKDMEDHINSIGILNPTLKARTSQSTTDETLTKTRSRPAELSPRGRGLSVNSDLIPSLPTPDFGKRHSGHFTAASPVGQVPSPSHYYYRDYYGGLNLNGHARGGSGSPIAPEAPVGSRPSAPGSGRPSTGRSIDSSAGQRPSIDSNAQAATQSRRDSQSTFGSNFPGQENRRFSGLFHSALPLPDETEESRKTSRASSRERSATNGYNILWLAASLFEFNIETTKHEAGYPYLTYQAGEIFDVIAEKGELWLAKNQDDPNDMVGWIWSKHFAKLADS